MSHIRDLIDVLMNASVSRGEVSTEDVAAAAKKLFLDPATTIKPDELIPLFTILPRAHLPAETLLAILPRFFDAEKQLGRNDASTDLVMSDFAGLAPFTGKAFVEAANTALTRVPFQDGAASEALAAACLKWSLAVLAEANKIENAPVVAARSCAIIAQTIRSSSFFFFAPIVDALRAVNQKLLPECAKVVVDSLIEPVLVQAAGLAAYVDFEKKHGKQLAACFAACGVAEADTAINSAQLSRKSRMIGLTKVLAGKTGQNCTIADIAKGLGLSGAQAGDKAALDLAENTVIDAATANLVAVQIDKNNGGDVQLLDIAVLRFDAAAWRSLKKRVDDFVAVTDRVAKQYELPAVN